MFVFLFKHLNKTHFVKVLLAVMLNILQFTYNNSLFKWIKKNKMQLLSLDAELLFPLRQFPFSAQTLGFSYEMKHLKH